MFSATEVSGNIGMSIARYLCVRRLFQKTYNPKSLFYLAYKTARLKGIDMSVLPQCIQDMQHDMDTQILACGEDIDHTLATEELKHWNWTTQSRLPIQLFLAVMHISEVPEWLDDTMLIENIYYFKELINIRDPYDSDELNEWNAGNRPFKTIWKICRRCYVNSDDFENYRFIYNKTAYIEDAEDIIHMMHDSASWCQLCHTCPLFKISHVFENSSNNMNRESSSSGDEGLDSVSYFI